MSLTPAQEMLNVKLNCDGFMTDSESEEEGVSKLSKKSGALIDVKSIILSPSSLLLRGFQTVNLIEELDLRQKNQHFPLGRAADRVRPECAPGQLGLLTALTRFHGDLAQVMNCRVCPDNAPGQLFAPHCTHRMSPSPQICHFEENFFFRVSFSLPCEETRLPNASLRSVA